MDMAGIYRSSIIDAMRTATILLCLAITIWVSGCSNERDNDTATDPLSLRTEKVRGFEYSVLSKVTLSNLIIGLPETVSLEDISEETQKDESTQWRARVLNDEEALVAQLVYIPRVWYLFDGLEFQLERELRDPRSFLSSFSNELAFYTAAYDAIPSDIDSTDSEGEKKKIKALLAVKKTGGVAAKTHFSSGNMTAFIHRNSADRNAHAQIFDRAGFMMGTLSIYMKNAGNEQPASAKYLMTYLLSKANLSASHRKAVPFPRKAYQ